MFTENLIWVLLTGIGIPGGMITGYWARKVWAAKQIDTAEAKLKKLIDDTKSKQKEMIIEAKDRALKTVEEAKEEAEKRRGDLTHMQERLEKRQELFDQKLLDLEDRQQKLTDRSAAIDHAKQEIATIREQQIQKLEKIAALTKDEAKRILIDNTEREMHEELLQRIKKLQHESGEEMEHEAKKLLSAVIQRIASSHAAETTTSVVSLPSDDMKGRIIGREGRNIKTLEQLTGVEIIVDETPESIIISGFSPIRRQLAKRALEWLIQDGRIQPARIEEAVERARKEMAKEIREAGEEAEYEVGITGIDPKLTQILGRLKYRTSYGQNILRHSIEISHLCTLLAEELGADVKVAKMGGLFHDIGKAVDHEVQGTHMEIGGDIGKKFGLPASVITCITTHHEDQPGSLEAVIVQVADAISGARPGARKDTFENYVKRLDELENLAKTFEGVEKAYAIQAGREIRVFVTPEKADDFGAMKIARDLAKKIEGELKYPGEIKVTVIREKRITEYAR